MNSEIINEQELEEISDADMEEIFDDLLEEADEEGISTDDLLNYLEFASEEDADDIVEEFITEAVRKKKSQSVLAKARKKMQQWLKSAAGKLYKKNQKQRRQKIKKGTIKVDKNLSKNRKSWAKLYNSTDVEGTEELSEEDVLEIELSEEEISFLQQQELISEDGLLDEGLDNFFTDEGDVDRDTLITFLNELSEEDEESITEEDATQLQEILTKISESAKSRLKDAAVGAAVGAGVGAAKHGADVVRSKVRKFQIKGLKKKIAKGKGGQRAKDKLDYLKGDKKQDGYLGRKTGKKELLKKMGAGAVGGAIGGATAKDMSDSFDAETLNIDSHMTAMFEGEEFSQDFKDRAATIFKAAVGQEIQVQLQKINEDVESHIETVEAQLAEEMTDNVDKYLNYVSEQWMEENKVAVEQQLRTELAEDFIVGLKGLFDAHYISVPESKVDLVDALQEKVEMLEGKLSEAINENLKLSDSIDTLSKETIVSELSQDLNIEETKKFKELAQSVEVNGQIVEQLETLKESYFGATASHSEDNEPIEQLTEGSMAAYAAVLDRTLK